LATDALTDIPSYERRDSINAGSIESPCRSFNEKGKRPPGPKESPLRIVGALQLRNSRLASLLRAAITLLLLLISVAALCAPETQASEILGTSRPLEITYCGLQPQRPPLTKLFFNITLWNRAEHTRWFLLPDNLYSRALTPSKGGIDAVEVFSAVPPPKVSVAKFMGTFHLQPESASGFQALLLPAGARISIRRFSIGYWGDAPRSVPVRLVIADVVTIGDTPAMAWTGADLLSDRSADVIRDELRLVHSTQAPKLKELPVRIVGTEEFTIDAPVAERRGPAC
jgi:hypothetical protein